MDGERKRGNICGRVKKGGENKKKKKKAKEGRLKEEGERDGE